MLGGDHSKNGNEREDEVNKMSHSRGLKAIKTALACEREAIVTENKTCLWGASVNFPK
jgi:hypothetical protein